MMEWGRLVGRKRRVAEEKFGRVWKKRAASLLLPFFFNPHRLQPPSFFFCTTFSTSHKPQTMALEGTAKTVVDILLVIFLPPLAVFLVRFLLFFGHARELWPPTARVSRVGAGGEGVVLTRRRGHARMCRLVVGKSSRHACRGALPPTRPAHR